MIHVGKWITKHRTLILILGVLLLLPSIYGYLHTKVNYDILSYLPKELETVDGQDILVDEFGMGAFSMVIVEGMENKDVVKLEEQIEGVEHVYDVLWYDDFMDLSVPVEMIPKRLQKAFFNGDATMMIALFDNTTSSDDTMKAVTKIRGIVGKNVFLSGMSGVVTDIKDLALRELPIYVVIAAVLTLLVLLLFMNSVVVPFIFLLTIGISVIYNLGSNVFLGDVSYITQALAAVMQLAVTMDYSIFLLESFEANKKKYPDDKQRAMAHAISNTFVSVSSSSLTTIAGFAALCVMTFRLGANLGIVMMKGVAIGVVVCVTILPGLILAFDPLIEKTTHKSLIPSLDGVSKAIVKHRYLALAVFLAILIPAGYGSNHYKIYYNIDKGLPDTIDSAIANEKLQDTFNMSTVHMVLLKDGLTAKEKISMIKQIDEVDGVKWALGMNSLLGASFPEEMIPKKVSSMLKNEHYELEFICSDYSSATDECNAQLEKIDGIVKSFQKDAMVIGEAPLMKDLQDVTDIDLKNVNYLSIAAIFIIIMFTFKSISIPIILVSVIEFAIACNMAVPYYANTPLAFVAGIVIGTIQLGATVDYAILMTNAYYKGRMKGKSKKEAVGEAHRPSIKPILTSGMGFFAATFGVAMYSDIDMIGSICTLLSRGALISTVTVIFLLPALLYVFDGVIIRSTWNMMKAGIGKKEKQSVVEKQISGTV